MVLCEQMPGVIRQRALHVVHASIGKIAGSRRVTPRSVSPTWSLTELTARLSLSSTKLRVLAPHMFEPCILTLESSVTPSCVAGELSLRLPGVLEAHVAMHRALSVWAVVYLGTTSVFALR